MDPEKEAELIRQQLRDLEEMERQGEEKMSLSLLPEMPNPAGASVQIEHAPSPAPDTVTHSKRPKGGAVPDDLKPMEPDGLTRAYRELGELLAECEKQVRDSKGYVDSFEPVLIIARCKSGENIPKSAKNLAKPKDTGVDFTAPILLPAYKKAISNPICLDEIKEKCKQGSYSRIVNFLDDMRLLLKNTKDFNKGPEANWVVQHAELLVEAAEEAVAARKKKLLDAEEKLIRQERLHKIPPPSKRKRETHAVSAPAIALGGKRGRTSNSEPKKPSPVALHATASSADGVDVEAFALSFEEFKSDLLEKVEASNLEVQNAIESVDIKGELQETTLMISASLRDHRSQMLSLINETKTEILSKIEAVLSSFNDRLQRIEQRIYVVQPVSAEKATSEKKDATGNASTEKKGTAENTSPERKGAADNTSPEEKGAADETDPKESGAEYNAKKETPESGEPAEPNAAESLDDRKEEKAADTTKTDGSPIAGDNEPAMEKSYLLQEEPVEE